MIKDESGNRRFLGVYRGTVVSNKDPLGKRRLLLKIPNVLVGETSGWAWPKESGSIVSQLPVAGQGVLVMFEQGVPDHPIWIGTAGKHVSPGSQVLVTPATSIPAPLAKVSNPDGTKHLDLTASLVALANKVTELEARIASLESRPDPDA